MSVGSNDVTEVTSEDTQLFKRIHWLINLRWLAVAGVVLATVFAGNIFRVSIRQRPVYYIATFIALYNLAMLVCLKYFARANISRTNMVIKLLIDVQIALDLTALTALLHYSGGIESPFVLFYVFHMVIASILLSVRERYLHATFSVILFVLLVLLEYKQIIPHYSVIASIGRDLHSDGIYILGAVIALAVTVYCVVYMTSVITIRLKKQEKATREANVQLKYKDRIKDEYVLRVTHDIKGHLAAIQSCLDVVVYKLVGDLNEKQDGFVKRAHNRTKKLTYFVRTLLSLTEMRISNNIEMTVFPLEEAIENATVAVQGKAEDKSIVLNSTTKISDDKVLGNQFSIIEMITNLLLNAIKYTPQGGTVGVDAKNDGDFVLVEISDSGIGIPKQELHRVFDEFFRASNAKKIEKDGTGLGLSIAKQVIERHGGKIWVESEKDSGTTFSFTLPKTQRK
jgi:signal transduction histidine kinase